MPEVKAVTWSAFQPGAHRRTLKVPDHLRQANSLARLCSNANLGGSILSVKLNVCTLHIVLLKASPRTARCASLSSVTTAPFDLKSLGPPEWKRLLFCRTVLLLKQLDPDQQGSSVLRRQ